MRDIENYIEAIVKSGADVVNIVDIMLHEQGQMLTKKQAGFVRAANTNFCKDCENFVSPNSCGLVAGVVWPHSTCQHFKKK